MPSKGPAAPPRCWTTWAASWAMGPALERLGAAAKVGCVEAAIAAALRLGSGLSVAGACAGGAPTGPAKADGAVLGRVIISTALSSLSRVQHHPRKIGGNPAPKS